MSLVTQATVFDIVSEFNGSGGVTPPYNFTLFNVGGITSGQIYDKITESNAALQGWTGIGGTTNVTALQREQIKRFEVAYGSARLAADIIGVIITDGFNYSEGGISVQRQAAEFNTYTKFITDHLMIAKNYISMLHQWFIVYNPTFSQGYTAEGNPVGYWRTNGGNWGG